MQRQHGSASRWRAVVIAAVMALVVPALLSPVAAQEDSITIPLNENENSGVSGTATLAAAGEATRVSMELSGDPVTGDHPSHIHTGTCADFDPDPLYPLTTVILDEVSDEGESETTVDEVALDDLLADDYVILVHPSAEELYPEWVCGDIKADGEDADEQAGTGDEQAGTGDEQADAGDDDGEAADEEAATGGAAGTGGAVRMPSSGVGPAAGGADNVALPAALGALAVLSAAAAGALLLRRGWRG